MPVDIGPGTYALVCEPGRSDDSPVTSTVVVTGAGPAVVGRPRLSDDDYEAPIAAYKNYVGTQLAALSTGLTGMAGIIAGGDRAGAEADYPVVHADYEKIGAVYDAFGDLDQEINGLADGLPGGDNDPSFAGFHKLEEQLWEGAPLSDAQATLSTMQSHVNELISELPQVIITSLDYSTRAHEILENALQEQVTGLDEPFSHTGLYDTAASVTGDQEVISTLRPLLLRQDPAVIPQINDGLPGSTGTVLASLRTPSRWTSGRRCPHDRPARGTDRRHQRRVGVAGPGPGCARAPSGTSGYKSALNPVCISRRNILTGGRCSPEQLWRRGRHRRRGVAGAAGGRRRPRGPTPCSPAPAKTVPSQASIEPGTSLPSARVGHLRRPRRHRPRTGPHCSRHSRPSPNGLASSPPAARLRSCPGRRLPPTPACSGPGRPRRPDHHRRRRPSLFDDRYGLAPASRSSLTPMAVFPNDDMVDSTERDGDISLQICADHQDTVMHALRDIAKHTRGGMQGSWKVDGFQAVPRAQRHPAQPARLQGRHRQPERRRHHHADALIWAHGGRRGEQQGAEGGSYQVIRIIRMLVEFWDRVSLSEQELMIGRRRDSGAPLGGTAEFDTPEYAGDPEGNVIPLTAHIRLANPRTAATDASGSCAAATTTPCRHRQCRKSRHGSRILRLLRRCPSPVRGGSEPPER